MASAGVVVVLGAALVGASLGLRPPAGRILPGVSVWGVAVGGQTPVAARLMLAEHILPALDRRLPLEDGERSWEVTPRELGCDYDLDDIVAKAMAVGRRGRLLRQLQEGWQARRHGISLKPRRKVDREVLARRLRAVARAAYIPAYNARIRFDGRAFHITPEQIGREVNAEETEKNIVRYFDPLSHRRVKLVARDRVPPIRAAELRQINARLGTFTTRFNPGDVNRSINLRLAAQALDGTVVPTGGVFSFNNAVGPRTEQRGYRVAKIFLKGEILDGVGGGICQVATTAYNAALESRLPVIARARPSRPVTYAPEGRDATVSYGGVDLRFRNTTGAPLLIQTQVVGSVVTVTLYGKRRG
ncbi:MAG: hypothetical protein GX774_05595 [Armatimonadetes bacterium]|nr:hypothetical protein [Armatimonadota bacterium]